MDFDIKGSTRLPSELYDYIVTKATKFKNTNYKTLMIEVEERVNKTVEPEFGLTDKLILSINGIASEKYTVRKIRNTEHYFYEYENMETYGWTPIKYSRTNPFVFAWVKAPYIIFTISPYNFRNKKLTKGDFYMIDKMFTLASRVQKSDFKFNIRKTVTELKNMLHKSQDTKLKTLTKDIEYYKSNIISYSNGLQENYMNLGTKVKEYNAMKKQNELDKKGDKTNYKQKLTALTNLEGVRTVLVKDDRITIITESLTAKVYDWQSKFLSNLKIGSFQISWGIGKRIEIKNLDKSRDYSYDHPHIEDGIPCWGNMKEIEELAAKMEIEVAISMILSYLCTVNTDDTFVNWKDWKNEWKSGEDD